MSQRLERVQEMLRRELAGIVARGELRDPRLHPTAGISVTGVDVSPDLSHARVFIDVAMSSRPMAEVLAGLNAGHSALRARLSRRIKLKRVPALRFFADDSIQRGASIERVLAEIHEEDRVRAGPLAPDSSGTAKPSPAQGEGEGEGRGADEADADSHPDADADDSDAGVTQADGGPGPST